jgi:hypothetical protein
MARSTFFNAQSVDSLFSAVFPGFIHCPNREPNGSGQKRKPGIP